MDEKNVPARIPEDSFFSCVFQRIISQERGFGEVAGIPVFFRCHMIFLQEFLWDRNSCIYPRILRIPEVSGGFLFPLKAAGSDQRLNKALC